jgi:putative transposase
MPRTARIVIPGVPHHVTQRGNRRQPTFFCPDDYVAYRKIAAEAFRAAGVEVWAYCLMPNHIHLIASPDSGAGLAIAVGNTHTRYTRMVNKREGWSGFLWQGRFASFPMDDDYLRKCIRYVGLNPVRAGLVDRAVEWPWSSVAAHVEGRFDPLIVKGPVERLISADVASFFDTDVSERERERFRRASVEARPLGSAAWVSSLGQES